MTVDISQRSAGFRAFIQEEQSREAAKTAKLLEPVQETFRQLHAEYRKAWATPIEKLAKVVNDNYWLDASVPDLGLPTADYDHMDPQTATTTGQAGRQKISNFIDELPTLTGYVLDANGAKRFRLFVISQVKIRSVEISTSNLLACFEYMMPDCFADSEYGFDSDLKRVESTPTPEREPPTMDEILATTDTTTKEGAAKLKAATDREWGQNLAPLVEEWYSHLRSDYGIVVSKEDADYLFNPYTGLFATRGWAITADNLNAARRHMHSIGRWAGALAVCEYIDQSFKNGGIDFATYNREFARLTRAGVWNKSMREATEKGLI